MTDNKNFTFSTILSLLIHIVIIINISSKKKKDDEIYVFSLSTYQQIQYEEQEKVIEKKIEPLEELKKEPKIIEKKELKKVESPKTKVEQLDKIPILKKQKPELNTKILEKKKVDNKLETKPISRKKEKVNDKLETEKPINQEKKKQIIKVQSKKNKFLIDQLLNEYLTKISLQINKMATQSYPVQSIKRREQGTIKTIITLDENGDVIELFFEDKRPKRLYTATKKIIESFNFPKPNKAILGDNKTLKIKIPVNFIIK